MQLYSPDTRPRPDGFGPDVRPHRSASGGPRPPRHRKPPSRRTRRAAALMALVLAGGVAAAGFLAAGGGHPAVTGAGLNARAVVSVPRPGRPDGAAAALPVTALPVTARPAAARPATGLPVLVGGPVQALVPTPAARANRAVRPARSAAAADSAPPRPSASASASPTTAPPSPSARPSPSPSPSASAPAAPAAGGGTCARPSFTTSDQFGSENLGAYTVANNMWNIGGGGVSQTLSACSASSWFVQATALGDGGGVKTYPNAHYTWAGSPAISSLKSVTSSFAQSSPGSGTFEYAYDIWLNGLPGSGNQDEVMIWTENHGQIPGGSPMATATIGGASYTVWRGSSNLISFVADTTVTAGTLNLLAFFQWLLARGWEPAGSTLLQVDYGVEVVSTSGAPETFSFSDFSVRSS